MSTTTWHMSLNIENCLRNNKGRKINFMSDDSGRELTDKEARQHLSSLLAKGHKLMCCSSECEGFDPFEKGCPGHPVEEKATE